MDQELLAFIGAIAVIAASFQLGSGLGGSWGYNTALDEVKAYGFEAVNERWNINKPGFIVRDQDLKRK